MTETKFENEIRAAVREFAMRIVAAVKGATLEELTVVSDDVIRGRAPGTSSVLGALTNQATQPNSMSMPLDHGMPIKKKRVVKNYPKCAFPGCEKNRFVRGKGFCGEHWRQFEAGQLKEAAFYKDQEEQE